MDVKEAIPWSRPSEEPSLERGRDKHAVQGSGRRRALLRKLDLKLVPILVLVFLMSYLDRINISNALTLGLQKRLHLQGNEVNTALAIFYVPYVLFEIPSNLLLKRLKPHVWLSGCMVAFGLVLLCHGFVKNFSGLVAVRFFLGVAEAGIFPGCSYLLIMWYPPDEALRRYAIFYNSVTLAGAFGSLLASAIDLMDGIREFAGWQWIFILEGIATIVAAGIAFIAVPNFPETATWLSADEREYMQARLKCDDDMSQHEDLGLTAGLKAHFSDYKSYTAALIYFGASVAGYSVSYFLPTIVKGFHYSNIGTQLRAVPPFAAAYGWSILLCFVSAKARHRLGFILFSFALALTGSGILLNVHRDYRTMYAATFLVTAGIYGGLPIAILWYLMNLQGHMRRAIGAGWMVGFGNIGGIIATFSFQSSDAPYYHKGYSIITFGVVLAAASALAFGFGRYFEKK